MRGECEKFELNRGGAGNAEAEVEDEEEEKKRPQWW